MAFTDADSNNFYGIGEGLANVRIDVRAQIRRERFVASADPDAPVGDLTGATFVRLTGPLFFANADALRERVEAAASAAEVEWVLLDFESVTDVDPTASEALADAIELVRADGKVIGICRATAAVRTVLATYGIAAQVGDARFFASNRAAMAAFVDRPASEAGS